MAESEVFAGFPKELVRFFGDLESNNNKEWFQKHKGDYENYVLHPSMTFVVEMGEKLREISPGVNAVPKVNKSLFRINRDTRFSSDKKPYKTHMGIFFWEGFREKRMDCSGYYFHLEKNGMFIGAGMHVFPKDVLTSFRKKIEYEEESGHLNRIIAELSQKEGISVGGKHYKKVPKGYRVNTENEQLLKHNGLSAMFESPVSEILFSAEFIDYCFEVFKTMSPLHKWLVNFTVA